eukprot:1529073-Pyramimonas_sp.AAC.2
MGPEEERVGCDGRRSERLLRVCNFAFSPALLSRFSSEMAPEGSRRYSLWLAKASRRIGACVAFATTVAPVAVRVWACTPL